jgi:predicted regulator of amino acid metabolism with ACT domain
MLGAVGSALGRHGINISTATQGVQRSDDELNVVIVVTDAEVPEAVLREVLDLPGVLDGRVVQT